VDAKALLDTGFDGDLAVPMELIANGQPPDEYRSWTLADGSMIVAPLCYGTVRVGHFDPVPADFDQFLPLVQKTETNGPSQQ
jgi:predicted aspartyl protease